MDGNEEEKRREVKKRKENKDDGWKSRRERKWCLEKKRKADN